MKKLFIIRHAKSSWDDETLNDFDRPLNSRGQKDAPRMANRLKEKGVVPDVVVSSTAARAMATCEIFCQTLNFASNKILRESKLYHADESQIFDVLRSVKDLDDDEEVVLLFGHNPGLTEFANSLLNEDIENIPTCGVVACEMKIDRWSKLQPGSGELEFFDFPKRKND